MLSGRGRLPCRSCFCLKKRGHDVPFTIHTHLPALTAPNRLVPASAPPVALSDRGLALFTEPRLAGVHGLHERLAIPIRNRTCGRERVIRPHLRVVSATRVAVLDFRTGSRGKISLQTGQKPLINASRMPLNYRFWQTTAIAPSRFARLKHGGRQRKEFIIHWIEKMRSYRTFPLVGPSRKETIVQGKVAPHTYAYGNAPCGAVEGWDSCSRPFVGARGCSGRLAPHRGVW